jgi:hypothetical protein
MLPGLGVLLANKRILQVFSVASSRVVWISGKEKRFDSPYFIFMELIILLNIYFKLYILKNSIGYQKEIRQGTEVGRRYYDGGVQPRSDRSSSWFPWTQNLANRALVRATIAWDLETIMDGRLKRPNPWRGRP